MQSGYKYNTTICHVYKTPFKHKGIGRWKVKSWEKIYYATINQRKAGEAILISDKVDFRAKEITRDKEATLRNDARRPK